MRGHCECPSFRGAALTCGALAKWLVQVGTRKADAQLSCGSHLSRTCEIMLGAEERRGASLTVAAVTS